MQCLQHWLYKLVKKHETEPSSSSHNLVNNHRNQRERKKPIWLRVKKTLRLFDEDPALLAPSGALVFIYHGLIEIRSAAQQPLFSNFSNSSDSLVKVKVKVKGSNMCYIFEKHGIQGY